MRRFAAHGPVARHSAHPDRTRTAGRRPASESQPRFATAPRRFVCRGAVPRGCRRIESKVVGRGSGGHCRPERDPIQSTPSAATKYDECRVAAEAADCSTATRHTPRSTTSVAGTAPRRDSAPVSAASALPPHRVSLGRFRPPIASGPWPLAAPAPPCGERGPHNDTSPTRRV